MSIDERTGERRGRKLRAAVQFVDLVGFSDLSERYGAESAYGIVTHCLRALDGIARSHRGSVDKYLGDRFLAVFGHPIPVSAPSSAAVRSALEMREWMARYLAEAQLEVPFGVHIGINTGEIVAGDVHGGIVREFDVLGDAVNVAARINAKTSPGQIFVGPDTHAETAEEYTYRAVGALALKGKQKAVETFELLGDRSALVDEEASYHAEPLIGRVAALASLRDRVSALQPGTGGAVLLTGPEGIGKSRLLDALHEDEFVAARRVVRLRCSPIATPDELADALRAMDPVPPDTVVLLDDAHWLREAALTQVSGMLARSAREPALWILALRDEGAARTALRGFEYVQELPLLPLEDSECRELLSALAEAEHRDEETQALVVARSGGNPARLIMGAHLSLAIRSERGMERIQARSSETERRRTAILFADITGFTSMTERAGAERAYPVVAACLDILGEVAAEFGGTVDHYLGDCALALFGVPEALEDAPRSAINAAIEMRRRVRAFNGQHDLDSELDIHSGIGTGTAIAGDVSGPLLREFAIMGDHVDRAYVLADLATAGEICVDEETHRHTAGVFAYESREPLTLSPTRSFAPFAVTSDRVHLHRARLGEERRVFSALVGRKPELERMRKRVAALARGEKGGVINLIAEAGIGKSRLVAELRDSAEIESVLWLEGRSISNGRNLSFHPFADLWRDWAGIDDEDDDAGASDKLGRAIDSVISPEEDVFLFFKILLGLPASEEELERLDLLGGDVLERLTQRATQLLVTRLCEQQPVLIVMDDLHWADLSSIEMLETLLPLTSSSRLLLVHVQRPGFAATSQRVLEATRQLLDEQHTEIALRPLDDRAARSLLRNVFGSGDVPHETRQMIEDKAGGNPFYIEEVVRSLLDAGAVELRDGALQATRALADFEIPGTIQDVVMARVDRLEPSKRRMLQVASVVGGTFHVAVLKKLVAADRDLDELLTELEDAEFIVPDDRLQGREFAFKHPLLQEVTYGGLLEASRKELHERVGETIESELPADTPGLTAMLAYHFTKAGADQRAEEFLLRAGEEAARSAASSEALDFFQEASRLYLATHGDEADPAKRALLTRNIARALFNRGRLIEAALEFNEAIRLLGQPVPHSLGALGLRVARRALPILGRLYLTPWLPRRPEASDNDREVIALMLERGICQTTVDPTRFVLDNLDMLATALRVEPATLPTAKRVLAGSATIFSYGGLSFALSRRLLSTAAELVDSGDFQGRLMEGVTNFVHHVLEGDWSPERNIDEALLEDAIERGLLWDVLTYMGLHTERSIGKGEFQYARERIERVRELWERYGHDLGKSTFHALSTYLALEEGRYEDAIEAAEVYFDENPEPLLHLLALAGRARAEGRLGRLADAEATLDRAERIVKELGSAQVPPYQLSHYLRARLYVEVSQLERALSDGDAKAIAAARRAAHKTRGAALRAARQCALRRVEILRLAGILAWIDGHSKRAELQLDGCLNEARRLGARPELARTHLEIAKRMRAKDIADTQVAGSTAREHEAQARELLDALGLPHA